jgi:DNA-binding HxlR family transcriptional regulator
MSFVACRLQVILHFSYMPRLTRSASSGSGARRSPCPIACSLDLIGDRWTLLVIRDLFYGKTRYSELLEAPEGIPTNVLADRLVKLESAGLIKRTPYQSNPPRYTHALTAKGSGLKPVLGVLADWGARYLPSARSDKSIEAALRVK